MIAINAISVTDNAVYVVERSDGGLYELNPLDFTVRFVDNLFTTPVEDNYSNMCRHAYKYDEKIYFIPYCSTHINVYDTVRKLMYWQSLPCALTYERARFCCGAIANNKLYMFGYDSGSIWNYDTQTNTYTQLKKCELSINKMIHNNAAKGAYIYSTITVCGTVYAVSLVGDFILTIDSCTDSYYVMELNAGNVGYSSIVRDGDFIWLVPHEGNIFVRYDTVSCSVITVCLEKTTCFCQRAGAVMTPFGIAVISPLSGNFFLLNTSNMSTLKIDEIYSAVTQLCLGVNEGIFEPHVVGDYIIASVPSKNVMLVWDPTKKVCVSNALVLHNDRIYRNVDKCTERPMFSLHDFIAYNATESMKRHVDTINGDLIYRIITND